MCLKKIMRKRSAENLEEPPRKRISPGGNTLPEQIMPGEILTDISGKQWRLGKTIGVGGFGEIYLASDNVKECVKMDAPFVIKVERHSNGPLFVEINCLLRIGRLNMINEWKEKYNLKSLGMPHYIASGSHVNKNEKIRFLVLPRYDQDLEKIFVNKQKKFNLKTVINICTQLLDVLEYVHSKGYIHCDIKASNILYSLDKVMSVDRKKIFRTSKNNPIRACRYLRYRKHNINLRETKSISYRELDDSQVDFGNDSGVSQECIIRKVNTEMMSQVYLMDYGLATKYRLSDGQHKKYCVDERKAHAGTTLFCSVDAHLGVTSRRSDLETLGYNMLYWLTSDLPWSHLTANPDAVQKKKEECLANLQYFLHICYPNYPAFIYEYFQYVKSLSFDETPDYSYCKQLFQSALNEYGYKEDGHLDFDNKEGWGNTMRLVKTEANQVQVKRSAKRRRVPLSSNFIVNKKHTRRISAKDKKINWSRILCDPEEILRQNNKQVKLQEVDNKEKPRERRITESSDTCTANLDIWALNPTYAMLEVFNKSRDKNGNYNNPPHRSGKHDGSDMENRKGYTPAMHKVIAKMCQNRVNGKQKEHDVAANFVVRSTRSNKVNIKKPMNDLKRAKASNFQKDLKRKPRSPVILRGYGLRG